MVCLRCETLILATSAATLVREDGQEDAVFSLIGPKRFDMPWKLLEERSWIAKAECFEVRVPMPDSAFDAYLSVESPRERYRLAAENPYKEDLLADLLEKHKAEPVLVIGQYLSQLKRVARRFELPLLTGQSPIATRERLFGRFREGSLRVLAVSSIANFALDLPEASCAIQLSGNFGSRQEEAQRLGRLLRPKAGLNRASFYTLVTQDSEEQSFARHRQLFLAEQGYEYTIVTAHPREQPAAASPASPPAAAEGPGPLPPGHAPAGPADAPPPGPSAQAEPASPARRAAPQNAPGGSLAGAS